MCDSKCEEENDFIFILEDAISKGMGWQNQRSNIHSRTIKLFSLVPTKPLEILHQIHSVELMAK